MDTETQNTSTQSSVDNIISTSDTGVCGNEVVGGAFDVKAFADKNSVKLFWFSVVAGVILLIMILMWLVGSKSNFTPKKFVDGMIKKRSKFGNYPNWYMQDGCAGYNCQVDTSSGKSLGFGMSPFENKSNFGPLPGVQNNAVSAEQQRKAAEELLAKQHMEAEYRKQHMEAHRQQHMEHMRQQQEAAAAAAMAAKKENMTDEEAMAQEEKTRAYIAARNIDEVGARQARVLAGCDNNWDPMATEEAKVLGAVGVFKPNTPGMSSFSKAVNENMPLTDSQLEAIMQGGEPYTIAPAGIQDLDFLSAQNRQEQAMLPSRKYS
jgi:hypothetical protein